MTERRSPYSVMRLRLSTRSKTIWMQDMYLLQKHVGGYSSSRCIKIFPLWNDYPYTSNVAKPLCMIQLLKQWRKSPHAPISRQQTYPLSLRPAPNFLKLRHDCYIQIVPQNLSGNPKKSGGCHGNKDRRLAEYSSFLHRQGS